MTTLCLDFGNTRWKIARFEDTQLKEVIVLKENLTEHLREVIQHHRPDKSILSSVVHHPPEVENLLKEQSNFHLLSNESKLPFTIPVGKPETVGADRLAITAAWGLLCAEISNRSG